MSTTPFVVGQWVRGKKFYGRTELIDEILSGPRNWLWLLGTRRIGKTSLLKQVEHLITTSETPKYFALFWDFQGSQEQEELHEGFSDSLLDAEERLEELDISVDDIETDDLFSTLGNLRRKLRRKKRKLMLLCDEVEELITLNQKDPSLLRKLRRAMQSQESVRSVLASTIRLWQLAEERGDTSPFLHGFTPPLYIHNLSDDETLSLIHQANMPDESRPRIGNDEAEEIRSRCDNHPYLVQLLCKRFLEAGNLEDAVEGVVADPMVSFFFSVDFEMLTEAEHQIIRHIAKQDAATSNTIQDKVLLDMPSLNQSLHRLQHLGYLRKNEAREFVLGNYFFRRWFRELPRSSEPLSSPSSGTSRQDAETVISTSETTLTLGFEPGMVLEGRYELVEVAGRGATGVVYKAQDTLLRATVAIKLLHSHYATNEEALERLRREIVLTRDIGHPNIMRIYHLGEYRGRKYLTMQWVNGSTLAEAIKADGPFPSSRAIKLGRKLAGALEASHARSVLHRDIKPQNILLDGPEEPFLTDFGLAREIGEPGITRSGIFLGTPDYASPEQASLQPLDERCDIYALGVVLFEMFTGRRPFQGISTHEVLEMHRSTPPPPPHSIVPEISRAQSRLILRCLEKDQSRRFQTAGELRLALERES